jgi:Xaa-Pro aminopeptidase
MSMDKQAVLMIAASEGNADMLYAVKMFVPDPFAYIAYQGTRTMIMSDLEIDRAREQAAADEVLSLTSYQKRLQSRGMATPTLTDVVVEFLTEREITSVLVPNAFPVGYADGLRAHGLELTVKEDPFFDERTIKTRSEVDAISIASRHTESAIQAAIDTISDATIKDGILVGPDGILTSEYIKRLINIHLLERDCVAENTIVACGIQGCDPHNSGSGTLRSGEPIIMDVFPKDITTGYYADITRTVVKGVASDALRRQYDTVLEGQQVAFDQLKDGADGQAIHRSIQSLFEEKGYQTGAVDGRMQGYFHGTGHGFGLEIHEPPRISPLPETLRTGQIVTVEPGLYYTDTGGVRIEDDAWITSCGYDNLTQLEKVLEI